MPTSLPDAPPRARATARRAHAPSGQALRQRTATPAARAGVLAALATALVLQPAPGHAQLLIDRLRQKADCELDHIADTRSRAGVSFIRDACSFLVTPNSAFHPGHVGFSRCILQVVPGSQSETAAVELASACRQRFPPD